MDCGLGSSDGVHGVLRADLPPELLLQAIAGTLRITLRFGRSLGADPGLVGEQVADLLLDGVRSELL